MASTMATWRCSSLGFVAIVEAIADAQKEFVIGAAKVAKVRHASGLGVEQFLATLVKPTAELARSPISRYYVGTVGLGVSGRIFRGVNLEFPKLQLNHSVHAKQFLVAKALQYGEKKLVFIVVSAASCGHCRAISSRVEECRRHLVVVDRWEGCASAPTVILPATQIRSRRFIIEKLPVSAGAKKQRSHSLDRLSGEDCSNLHVNLGATEKVSLKPVEFSKEASLRSWLRDDNPSFLNLKSAAFVAANVSYAPYSRCPSVLSIVTSEGKIYSGSYMESAAYNPRLPTFQAAIVAFIYGGGGDYDDPEVVVLVEIKGALVRYASTVRLALHNLAPLASFHHFEAKKRHGSSNHTS